MKISAAIIVKNEEKNLPRLLKSIKNKFDEIVVVDTGSTDKTIEIAKNYGCKVFEKEWNGFADARNFAIEKCIGDWIWHFDADFELEDKEFEKLKKYINLIETNKNIKTLTIYVRNFGNDGSVKSISTQAFIHRNKKEVFWIGNIHERLNVQESFGTDIFINHFGYEDLEVQKIKAYRNLDLIKKDLENFDNDSREYFIKLFYLFQTYTILSYFDKKYMDLAIKKIDEFLVLSEKQKDDAIKFFTIYTYIYISDIYIRKKDFEKALFYVDEGLKKADDYPDLIYMKALIYQKLKNSEKSKKNYLKFLELVDKFEKMPINKDRNVAVIIDKMGNIPDIIEKILPSLLNEEDIEYIKNRWKKEKNRYFAYLLAKLYEKYDKKNYEKFILKASKVHNYYMLNNLIAKYCLNKNEFFSAMKFVQRTLEENRYDKTANEVMAVSLYKLKEYKEAIKYFKNALFKEIKPQILSMFIECLKKEGFNDEATLFIKKYKNLQKN